MRGVIHNLHVQYGRESTEALRANAEFVHSFHDFKPQLFSSCQGATLADLVDINRVHQ